MNFVQKHVAEAEKQRSAPIWRLVRGEFGVKRILVLVVLVLWVWPRSGR